MRKKKSCGLTSVVALSAAFVHAICNPHLIQWRYETGVDETHATLSRLVNRLSVIGLLLIAVVVVGVNSVLFC